MRQPMRQPMAQPMAQPVAPTWWKRRYLSAACLALAISGAGCWPVPEDDSVPVTTAPTFMAIRAHVFAPSCAFSACHGGSARAAGLDLLSATACADLVAKSSCLFPERRLIVPGNPDASFLHAKVTGEQLSDVPTGPCAGGSNQRMPLGAVGLSEPDLAAVRGWIANGASCDIGAGNAAGGAGGG